MSAEICTQPTAHDAVLPAHNIDGTTVCVICYPLREPDSSAYWDYAADGSRTAFDDTTRTATEYPADGGEGVPRPYDAAENARADAIASATALRTAQSDYGRAVGLNSAPDQLAALQAATLAAEGVEPGDPWRQPTGAHDAYPLDAEVTHNGKSWRSTVAANVWEPGVSGWAESGAGIPEWVQPTGAHDAYALGAVVRHNGLVWQSDVDANVWEPGVSQWTEIPDPEADA